MKTSADKASSASAHVASRPFFAKPGSSGFFTAANSAPPVQLKMTVNQAGDKYEQEADKMSERVMREPAPSKDEKLQRQPQDKLQKSPKPAEEIRKSEKKPEKLQKSADNRLQKAAAADDKIHKKHHEREDLQRAPKDVTADDKIHKKHHGREDLQRAPARDETVKRKSGDSAPVINDNVQTAIRNKTTGGQPLAGEVKNFMEPRFGADFSHIRVHHDGEAASLNNRLSAKAFTFKNHVFFSRDQYRPGTSEGKQLIAHELTHTIQQGHAVQRSPQISSVSTPPPVQRLGLQDALDYFADKAYLIPGFRLLTLLLGFNPINMQSADRNAANLLRALIELIPGGAFITQALDNHGVINKAAAWVEQKLAILGDIGSDITGGLKRFVDSLSWKDIFDLGGVWARAKSIFTEPIGRLIAFGGSVVVEILKMVKDAILKPLAALAQGTSGYDLLKAMLGEDPISGEAYPPTAENLLGGFMKLIGQEDIWENIKKGNAIARAWAWFQGALDGLMGFVRAIPRKIVDTITSLTFQDVITVVGAFGKIVSAFANIAVDFISWGLNSIWNLLEIIFDVVKPGLMTYIKKTGAALKGILKDPLPFVGNLVNAGKLGFQNFANNFGGHLKAGLIDWLTGSLEGVYIPKALSLPELGKFALSVLGITWAQIRGKIVKVLGPNGETIMQGLETAFDIVVALVKGGTAAAWELIKEKLSDLKDTVVSGIVSFVTDTIVKKAIPKLISMFIPGAGFISAIMSIYDTIMVFVQKISKIIQVVTAFIDSMVTIAAGNITAAANRVESILGGLLSLAISFLAGFLGLGKVTDKIMGVIQKVRASVDKAIDAVIAWIVGKAKALFGKLFGGKDNKPKDEKWSLAVAGVKNELGQLEKNGVTGKDLEQALPNLKNKYGFTSLRIESTNQGWRLKGAMSPEEVIDEIPYLGSQADPYDIDWPKPAAAGYPTLYFGGISKEGKSQAEMKALNGNIFAGETVRPYQPTVPSSELPGGDKVGLTTTLAKGTVIGPVTSASTPGGGRINRIFAKYGFRAGQEGLDGDHVQEIQFGGLDVIGNLWPLNASINRGAGSKLAQMSVSHPRASGQFKKVSELKADPSHKYYFRIKSTL